MLIILGTLRTMAVDVLDGSHGAKVQRTRSSANNDVSSLAMQLKHIRAQLRSISGPLVTPGNQVMFGYLRRPFDAVDGPFSKCRQEDESDGQKAKRIAVHGMLSIRKDVQRSRGGV
ncbi:hypothetical protein AC579_10051 [Pseudocercospora musae]|uniref:Uncharacterized protein n=1 Tax=Pseudocercospora musae TaxID=113226 RepID=A0A139I665_9PEZI|nr:hypothetical protein AC579_10051 [Pseudocercospora musae]